MLLYLLSIAISMTSMAGDTSAKKNVSVETVNDIINSEFWEGQPTTSLNTLNNTSETLEDARANVKKKLENLDPHKKEHGLKKSRSNDYHRRNIFGYLTEIDQFEGNQDKTKNARILLGPDKRTPSLSAVVEDHGGKVGLATYQGIDSSLAYNETTKKAEGLAGKTARDVQAGFQSIGWSPDGITPINSIMRAVRPAASISYGLMPFAHDIATSKLGQHFIPHDNRDTRRTLVKPQSTTNKALGATNLLATGISELYSGITAKNRSLTPYQAYLLSILNRRHGVPVDITHYKKTMSILAKVRWLIKVVGMAALPGLVAIFTRGKNYNTSPALFIGNLASIADALAGIYENYRTQRLIKQIKAVTPLVEKELERKPLTDEEKAMDKSEEFDFGGNMNDLMGMQ